MADQTPESMKKGKSVTEKFQKLVQGYGIKDEKNPIAVLGGYIAQLYSDSEAVKDPKNLVPVYTALKNKDNGYAQVLKELEKSMPSEISYGNVKVKRKEVINAYKGMLKSLGKYFKDKKNFNLETAKKLAEGYKSAIDEAKKGLGAAERLYSGLKGMTKDLLGKKVAAYV